MPDDVRHAVAEVTEALRTRLPWAVECAPPVELLLTRTVEDGAARYRPDERLIEIEIPTSPTRFRESLVHELAHHVDATCPGLDEVRRDFLAGQGIEANATWNAGGAWNTDPSEQFAEAVVLVVTGDRILHGRDLPISADAAAVVRRGP